MNVIMTLFLMSFFVSHVFQVLDKCYYSEVFYYTFEKLQRIFFRN